MTTAAKVVDDQTVRTDMAYALFKDDEKLSRTFPTKEETLKKAEDAGLVESSEGKPRLEDDLKIKPCSPDPEPRSEDDLDWTPGNPTS
ncbi:hypothetical protein [Bradyrhizobium sp. 1]|uniref:hypothetical protein n=1 Tax=Bradyrhizobium sp. 1 TaxID=241591 RepID=UPI001FF84B1F